MKRLWVVAVAGLLWLVTVPCQAQTAAQFQAARDIVTTASAASAFQCPGTDRTVFLILLHAESVTGERRCAALHVALHCVTAASRTGLPSMSNGDPRPYDPKFRRFRQDGASLAFAAALEAAIRALILAGGC